MSWMWLPSVCHFGSVTMNGSVHQYDGLGACWSRLLSRIHPNQAVGYAVEQMVEIVSARRPARKMHFVWCGP